MMIPVRSLMIAIATRMLSIFLTSTYWYRGITLIEATASQNVSVGQMVEFTCASSNSESIITWKTVNVESTATITENIPGGGQQSVLRFAALQEHNNTNVRCFITDPNTSISIISTALLLVQGLLSTVGMLTNTVLDNCTLYCNWTAPYTLQGVPINYYTINITRYSDGAVLRSDTANTTGYLYNVSVLGETLEVVVAAVNDVGIGNASSIIKVFPSLAGNLTLLNAKRNGSTWIFDFHNNVRESALPCIEAISEVTVNACHPYSSCVIVSASIADDGRRVIATFSNLMENKKYSASVRILYSEGMEQQSKVEISTFDVQNVSVTMLTMNRLCLVVGYIEGHKSPYAFLKLMCPLTEHIQNTFIEGTKGCINIESLNSSQNCCLSATDVDALDIVDTTPAIVITEILITREIRQPTTSTIHLTSHSFPLSSLAISTTPTVTPIGFNTGECHIALCIGISAAAIMTVLIVTMMLTTCICCCVMIKNRSQTTHCSGGVAKDSDTTPPFVLYEKVDDLTHSTAMQSSHNETTAPSPPPRLLDNMGMEECQAYGVSMCTVTKNTTAPSLPPQQLSNIEMVECKAYDTSSTQMNNIEMKKCQAYDMVARK